MSVVSAGMRRTAGTVLLLLLRHGKSAWPAGVADLERPLAPRGERGCVAVGNYLTVQGWRPDVVVASPSRRTVDTAARVLAQQLSSAPPVCVDDRLYGGDIAAIVAEQSPATQVLMLVGHQPELESLLLALTDQPITLPTAALAALEMASWDSIGDARLLDFVTPKRLARQAEPG